jgi:hypothetical protein
MSDNENSNGFIELNRTFREMGKHTRKSDDADLTEDLFGPGLGWDDLLKGHRTVILSEAGAGKTEEIRYAAKRLRDDTHQAFFLRLEHMPDDFEDAFEVGTFEEFGEWLASADEGWFLLDSVDEARLRNPGDFERAIRKLGRRIRGALSRAHIILTGRTSAWRAKTDLELCERHLPFAPATSLVDASTIPDDLRDATDSNDLTIQTRELQEGEAPATFRVVAIQSLSTAQIEKFARSRGVTNTRTFLDEIERADAQSFTARPQDLEELIAFWNSEHRIGTRLQLMQNSVQRRLEERDENRRQAYPLASTRAREGVRLLAAASILGLEATIQVPDGSHNMKGLPIQSVLPDWDDRDQHALLSRPIFDEAIYGTVRFHHRSVREFLAAEWLTELLKRSASRREVEALLFRVQYGVEVVVPTMRPVLPWLAILDERIRERIQRVAPEILFEGGDPSALPLTTRKGILAEVCRELASGAPCRSALEYSAVQRFASPDLAEDIGALLRMYATDATLIAFLLRMVWLGGISPLKDAAKAIAIDPTTSKYARIAAIRALRIVGVESDLQDLRRSFVSESASLTRDLLAEIVDATPPSDETVLWLLAAVKKATPKERHGSDSLADSVVRFAGAAPTETLPVLARGLNDLLEMPPFIEHEFCQISKQNAWGVVPASTVAARMIRERHDDAPSDVILGILHKCNVIGNWDDDARNPKMQFHRLVPQWPELNRALFWFEVRKTRQTAPYSTNGARLTNFWQVLGRGTYWNFEVQDFDYVLGQLSLLADTDDQLVALTLAFDIYVKGDRLKQWLNRLQELVAEKPELKECLEACLAPPVRQYEQEERKWKKQAAAREKRDRASHAKTKAFILSNIELARAAKLGKPSDISRVQWYLHERLRENKNHSNRWTTGGWRELIPEYGEEVAHAYRQGVTAYWRNYHPMLRSEGALANSTPVNVIFGLSGLEIEANETPDWPADLSRDDIRLAFRYATYELNGFPPWFSKLFDAFPEAVSEFIFGEVQQEVLSASLDVESHYLLSDLSWAGQWAWDGMAPKLLQLLKTTNVTNLFNLGKLLVIVQGADSVTDDALAQLAEDRAKSANSRDVAALWYAAWVGVDPNRAVPSVAEHLSSIALRADQTEFAMTFVTQLTGGRLSGTSRARQRYSTPHYLKVLYLLMLAYIREDEDIDRSGGGVYSPGLRDDAQDARNALVNRLRGIHGKEAFIALSLIATEHPNAQSRPWIASQARERAEQDADLLAPWSPKQVRDFHEHLDRTPSNHRELADLAVMRLLDMKDDLENGDDSVAKVLQRVDKEPEMRNFLAHELRSAARGRYTITQEEELADAKRPDLRFHGAGFDAPVPAELKLAERWTGPKIFERFENQLAGDYLRDNRSGRGIFVLVNRAKDARWDVAGHRLDFDSLIDALCDHWRVIANMHPHVDDVTVIGIDLTKRFN